MTICAGQAEAETVIVDAWDKNRTVAVMTEDLISTEIRETMTVDAQTMTTSVQEYACRIRSVLTPQMTETVTVAISAAWRTGIDTEILLQDFTRGARGPADLCADRRVNRDS
jgi:hypothetical protein